MAVNRIKKFSILLLGLGIIGLALFPIVGCGSGGGGGSDSSAGTPNISASKSSLDFSGVVLSNSVDQTVEITNTGNANLSIGQISNSSPNPSFSVAADACSNTALAPSKTCSLRVRFAPANQGSFTGSLSIPSNDPDSSVVSISLQGEGYGLNVWINKVESSGCQGTIDVTVTDPLDPGTQLHSLTWQNFKVYENGVQVQGITATPIQYPSPVSVALALDFSESEEGVLNTITASANFFINQLNFNNQLNDGDYAAIWKFNANIGYYPDEITGLIPADDAGKLALTGYINASFPQKSGTLLFTAINQAIDRVALGPTEKRAVIVLSDGIPESDDTEIEQVIADAVQKGIPLFAIYYVDPNFATYTDEQRDSGMLNMQRLAGETGGQYYNGLTADLTDVFAQIANVLSNKYTLTYTSSTCSGTNSLDVEAYWDNGSIVLYGADSAAINF